MYDAVLEFAKIAGQRSTILTDLGLKPGHYLLATIHRPYNTDVPENLESILRAFLQINDPIVFPIHPRTKHKIDELNFREKIEASRTLKLIEPVGYLDMLTLEQNARLILTDSGGMQKEAYFFGVPCITLRPETEWIETVEMGWNVVIGADRSKVLTVVNHHRWPTSTPPPIFGDGQTADHIVQLLGDRI
jgi:UDP-N-acetylglucosamine 2-epimerase